MKKAPRRATPRTTELSVLDQSRRRCALCFHIDGSLTEKHGQIAHLDRNPANYTQDNLAFLCLTHHSLYDSRTSQHKNYTMSEIKKAREDLYRAIQQDHHLSVSAIRQEGRQVDRAALKEIVQRLSKTINRMRKWSFNGTSFPIAWFDPLSEYVAGRSSSEFEFIDDELESYRKALLDRFNRLERLIATNARPAPQAGWYCIPTEWIYSKPSHYAKMAGRLDAANRQACENYDKLVRTARRKLEQ